MTARSDVQYLMSLFSALVIHCMQKSMSSLDLLGTLVSGDADLMCPGFRNCNSFAHSCARFAPFLHISDVVHDVFRYVFHAARSPSTARIVPIPLLDANSRFLSDSNAPTSTLSLIDRRNEHYCLEPNCRPHRTTRLLRPDTIMFNTAVLGALGGSKQFHLLRWRSSLRTY